MSECIVTPYFTCDNLNESLEQGARKTLVKEAGTENVGIRVYIACSDASGGGITVITDATVISNITNEANWNPVTGYSGSLSGLTAFSFYRDMINRVAYFYDGLALIRYNFNDVAP